MIDISNVAVTGFESAVRGMRNPMNSWNKSDSGICRGKGEGYIGCPECADYVCYHNQDGKFHLGVDDYALALRLAKAGSVDGKFRRMIVVYMDILAPLYWWKEFDTYKVGTVANSCSTMHKLTAKEFEFDDFSHEHLSENSLQVLQKVINALNDCRDGYLRVEHDANDKILRDGIWWNMIQLLPSSYNQKRTVMLNYEVLSNMYKSRWNHKLKEWRDFCSEMERLPYSELFTCNTRKPADYTPYQKNKGAES